MICLPYAGCDSFGCKNRIDTRMDVASLVSRLTSNLGRLTAKHQCNFSPLAARYDSSSADASSPSSSVASLWYWSRNVGFSCGSSLHTRSDGVLTVGSASQIDENGDLSDTEAASDHHIPFEKKSGSRSETQATKDTVCSEPSFYDTKPSVDYSSSAGSNKSQSSLPALLTNAEKQHIRNNQIPLCGAKVIMPDLSHIESDTRLSEVTLETEIAKAPCIQSFKKMQAGLDPSLDSAHWSESNSVNGVSHIHAREEDADMWIKEDQGGLRMYAHVESEGLENSHEQSHGSSYHAQDICLTQSFLKCHAFGSGHSSADHPVSLKEMNLAREEPANDTDSMSVVRLPSYRRSGGANWSSRLTESILYLDSLGVDSSRLIQEEPTAMTYDIKRLRELVRVLEGLGLNWKDLGKIFNLCPRIIHLCPVKDIKLVTNFLFDEVGLLPKHLSKVIKRCPRLLACDVVDQLSPTLFFLQTLGFSNMGQVVANNATLLSLDVEKKLIPKLEYLQSLGFTNREVVSMVNRFPALFNYNVKENLEPKYEYLVHEMGGSNRDLLAFPQYFGYSLVKRIIPRYQCIAKQDVSLSIQAMLKLSEAEFIARFHSVSDSVNSSKQEISDVGLSDCAMESSKLQGGTISENLS